MKFEEIVKMTQPELWSALFDYYNEHLCSFVEGDYLSIMGDIPVMLVAHLDTVHHEQVKHICKSEDGNIIMSPQGIGGDDRCGVYALMQIYKTMPEGMKPYLLFTCDEETGGNGAYSFCEDFEKGNVHPDLYEMNYLIEVDRRGLMEAVYYDCDNPEFEKLFQDYGFDTYWGTFSDISYLAPTMGCAAVNLSAGYYNPHTNHEYINMDHLQYTIDAVCAILTEDNSFYQYVEAEKSWEKYSPKGWDYISKYDGEWEYGNYYTSKK